MNLLKLLQEISYTINNKVENNCIYYNKGKINNNWLGFQKADLINIEKKEQELGIKLPPSYREFLEITNGFRQISLFSGNLYPIEQINWTKKKDPEFLEIFNIEDDIDISDKDYFVYNENQRSVLFKVEYLYETLQISDWLDGSVIFLNPKVKFGEEWEAWIYANWFPGAKRYKSFYKLLEGEFTSTIELIKNNKN